MENNNKVTVGCATPAAIIIFLAFFFAKIFDKIDWSWLWVFSPLWIPIAFIGILMSIMCVFYILMLVLGLWKK